MAQQAQLDEADEVSRQMELHNRMAAERAQHRHKKHSNICLEVLDQIEDLATKIGEYRLLTGKYVTHKLLLVFLLTVTHGLLKLKIISVFLSFLSLYLSVLTVSEAF